MESFIQSKVAKGLYGDAAEVVRDAVRRMQAEEIRLAAWNAAIQKGAGQLDRNQGIDYTPSALSEITEDALRAVSSDWPVDPDVLP